MRSKAITHIISYVISLTHAAYIEHFTQVYVLKDIHNLVSQLTYTPVQR